MKKDDKSVSKEKTSPPDNKKSNIGHIHIGPNEDFCVCCGAPVPEGTTVCSNCWKKYF